jgi:hypothetical protein
VCQLTVCLSVGDTVIACAPIGATGPAVVGEAAGDDAAPIVEATETVALLDKAPAGTPPTGKCSAVAGTVVDAPETVEPEGDT